MGKTKRKSKLRALRKQKEPAYARPHAQYAHEAVEELTRQISSTLEDEIERLQKKITDLEEQHKLAAANPAMERKARELHLEKRKWTLHCTRLNNIQQLWNQRQFEEKKYLTAIKTRMLLEARQAPKVNMHWGSLEGLVTTPHQVHVFTTHPLHKLEPSN